jgi:gamma-glutamyl-gamma-aminobutyrate hydrolase PuuD
MKTIALSMRITEAANYHEPRNSIALDYIDFFEELGYLVILVPNNSKCIDQLFEKIHIDGIVLSGGNNVDPSLFNDSSKLVEVYPVRDKTEYQLINIGINKKIPILGICRGFHMINVFFGGSISMNINGHVEPKHVNVNHKIKYLDKEVIVNSYHNHGITDANLSQDLEPLSYCGEIVEAFEAKKHRILAIQWHPERQTLDFDKQLVTDFLNS